MTPILTLALQAAPAPATELTCTLVTPSGQSVAFALQQGGGGAATLAPANGSIWPGGSLTGAGRVKGEGGKRKGEFLFGSGKGAAVRIAVAGSGAVLYLQGRETPRAYGFCLDGAQERTALAGSPNHSAASAPVMPAFDSATWPDQNCALLTRSGRKARIEYSILNMGSHTEIKTADTDLFGKTRVVVSRRQGSGAPSLFGSRNGFHGAERLITDRKIGEAVQLIDLAGVGGGAAPSETAVAICGHKSIVRRPATR